jgi:hypothetical protein
MASKDSLRVGWERRSTSCLRESLVDLQAQESETQEFFSIHLTS